MRNRRQTAYRSTVAFLAALLLAAGVMAVDFELAHQITLDGFETRAVAPDGKKQWEIRGERAKLRGGLYDLEDIVLVVHLDNGTRVDIASPHCLFDHARGIARSDAPLKVVAEDMTLEGQGYDLATARKILRIRNQVKMTIRKMGGHLSPTDVFGNFGAPRQPADEPTPDKREDQP